MTDPKRYVLLDSIAVSRESIGVLTKLIESMPDLTDEASQIIWIEQSNIKKEVQELVNHIRGSDEK